MSKGEKEAFKKSLAWEGTIRTENRYCSERTSEEQRKMGEVIQEVSKKKNVPGAYETDQDSKVLLGAQLTEAKKADSLWYRLVQIVFHPYSLT